MVAIRKSVSQTSFRWSVSSPAAVCVHPDPSDGDDAESILFSMVCDLEARRMWVAPGNPCTTPYEEIDLSDLA